MGAEVRVFGRDDRFGYGGRNGVDRNPDALDPRAGESPLEHQRRDRMSESIKRSHNIWDEQDDNDDRHGPAEETQGTAAGKGAHGARIKHGHRPLLNAAGPSRQFEIEWRNG